VPSEIGNSINQKIADQSPRKTARIAGFFYLMFFITFVSASIVRSRIIVFGDAATTANNILSAQGYSGSVL